MDCEAMDKLVDQLYQVGMTGIGWSDLLVDTVNAMPEAAGAWIVFANPEFEHFEVISPRSDPEVIDNYQRYWWRHDITTAVTSNAPVGRCTTLADTGRKRFLHSRFYNEFWRYSGQPAERIAVNLHVQGQSRISFGIQQAKSHETLSADLLDQVNRFVPHLSRAVEIYNTMRGLELRQRLALAARTDLVALVDDNSRITYAADSAIKFMHESSFINLKPGSFEFSCREHQKIFRQLMSSCCPARNASRGGKMLCCDNTGKPELEIEVMPFHPRLDWLTNELPLLPPSARLIVFTDISKIREDARLTLQDLFELTAAESNVALELMRGDTRAQVAERMGVKLSTVRTHMMHIFDKVGVNSRTELISHLMQSGIDRKALV